MKATLRDLVRTRMDRVDQFETLCARHWDERQEVEERRRRRQTRRALQLALVAIILGAGVAFWASVDRFGTWFGAWCALTTLMSWIAAGVLGGELGRRS